LREAGYAAKPLLIRTCHAVCYFSSTAWLREAGYTAKPLLIRACPKVCFFGTTLGFLVLSCGKAVADSGVPYSVLFQLYCMVLSSAKPTWADAFLICRKTKVRQPIQNYRFTIQNPFPKNTFTSFSPILTIYIPLVDPLRSMEIVLGEVDIVFAEIVCPRALKMVIDPNN